MISIISTRIHGIFDYIIAAYLILCPWVYGFWSYTFGPWIMMIVGVLLLIYSVMTRYELGYVGLISMTTHLWFDLVAGVFLFFSPWILNYSERVHVPQMKVALRWRALH